MSYRMGDLAGRTTLFVMAAEAEYGPALRARFNPLMTGVGPVEAALKLTRTLTELALDGRLPDLVLSLGSAGSAVLEQTEIYQASELSYRDMDASPLGFTKGETPFLGLPAVLTPGHAVPGIPQARLSTGANIVSGAAYQAIDAEMVDMESFALYRVTMDFGVPFIGLRGISDGKAELRHVGDWTEYLHVIDDRLAAALDLVEAAIESGAILGQG